MISNPQLTSGGTITIDGLTLQVRGAIIGTTEVGAQDERKFLTDVPAVYNDWSRGLGASQYSIPGMYADGRFIDTFSNPGVALPAGKLIEVTRDWIGYAPGALAAYVSGGNSYVVAGRAVYKLNLGTSPSVILVRDLGLGTSGTGRAGASVALYQGDFWIGTFEFDSTWGAVEQWDPDTNTWTTHTAIRRRHLVTLDWQPTGTPRKVMLGTTSPFHIQWVYGDPTVAADWLPTGSPTLISDLGYHILSVVAGPEHVWFGTQGGIRDLTDQMRSPNLTPHWKTEYDINNGGMMLVQDEYIYACHAFGLVRVALTGARQDIPEPCGPGQGLPYSGEIYGRPQAGCTWNGWLIVGFYNHNTNETHVCFGKDKGKAGVDVPGPLVWHGSYATVPGRVTLLQVVSVFGQNPWLVIGTADAAFAGNAAYKLYIQSLPMSANAYQELLNHGHHLFNSTATLYLADGWPEYPTANRDIWTGDLQAEQMLGTQHIVLTANRDSEDLNNDGDLDYIEIGRTQKIGVQEYLVPTDFGTAGRLQFKLDFDGTEDQAPVLIALRVRADINFKLSDVRTYTVDLRDDQQTPLGTDEMRSAKARLGTLKRLCDRGSTQVTMRDEFGDTWQVRLLDISWPESALDQDQWGMQPKLVIRFLRKIARYNNGELYNTGVQYG